VHVLGRVGPAGNDGYLVVELSLRAFLLGEGCRHLAPSRILDTDESKPGLLVGHTKRLGLDRLSIDMTAI